MQNYIITSLMAELKSRRGKYKCLPANLFHLGPLITLNVREEMIRQCGNMLGKARRVI